MKTLLTITFAIVASLISSCSTTTSPTPVITTKTEPVPSNWKALSLTAIKKELKDPSSAKFEEWNNKGGSVSVTVNAKNAFGGYAGAQLWFVKFSGGKAVKAEPFGFGIKRLSDIR